MPVLNHCCNFVVITLAAAAIFLTTVDGLSLAHKRLETTDPVPSVVDVPKVGEEGTGSKSENEQVGLPSEMGRQKIVGAVPYRSDAQDVPRGGFNNAGLPPLPSATPNHAEEPKTTETDVSSTPEPHQPTTSSTNVQSASEGPIVEVMRTAEKTEGATSTTETVPQIVSSPANANSSETVESALIESDHLESTSLPQVGPTALPEFLRGLTNLTLDVSKETEKETGPQLDSVFLKHEAGFARTIIASTTQPSVQDLTGISMPVGNQNTDFPRPPGRKERFEEPFIQDHVRQGSDQPVEDLKVEKSRQKAEENDEKQKSLASTFKKDVPVPLKVSSHEFIRPNEDREDLALKPISEVLQPREPKPKTSSYEQAWERKESSHEFNEEKPLLATFKKKEVEVPIPPRTSSQEFDRPSEDRKDRIQELIPVTGEQYRKPDATTERLLIIIEKTSSLEDVARAENVLSETKLKASSHEFIEEKPIFPTFKKEEVDMPIPSRASSHEFIRQNEDREDKISDRYQESHPNLAKAGENVEPVLEKQEKGPEEPRYQEVTPKKPSSHEFIEQKIDKTDFVVEKMEGNRESLPVTGPKIEPNQIPEFNEPPIEQDHEITSPSKPLEIKEIPLFSKKPDSERIKNQDDVTISMDLQDKVTPFTEIQGKVNTPDKSLIETGPSYIVDTKDLAPEVLGDRGQDPPTSKLVPEHGPREDKAASGEKTKDITMQVEFLDDKTDSTFEELNKKTQVSSSRELTPVKPTPAVSRTVLVAVIPKKSASQEKLIVEEQDSKKDEETMEKPDLKKDEKSEIFGETAKEDQTEFEGVEKTIAPDKGSTYIYVTTIPEVIEPTDPVTTPVPMSTSTPKPGPAMPVVTVPMITVSTVSTEPTTTAQPTFLPTEASIATGFSDPTLAPPEPSARPIDDIAEVTLFDKIMAGVRCSMRDCTGALRPTKKPIKAVLNSTVIRKARRNYEGCECSKTTRKPTSLN